MEPKDGLQWEMNNKTLAAAQPALLGAQLQPQLKNELCTLRHRLMSCHCISTRQGHSCPPDSCLPGWRQGACCQTGHTRSNSVALRATRSDQSETPACGKLGPGETMGSPTWRPARLHFTSQQVNVGTTNQNKATTKSTTFSEVFELLLPCTHQEL